MYSRNICASLVRRELQLSRVWLTSPIEYWVSLIEPKLKELAFVIGEGFCYNSVRDRPCCEEQVTHAQSMVFECLRLLSCETPLFHIIKSDLAYMQCFLLALGCMFCPPDAVYYHLNIRRLIDDLNLMLTEASKI